MSAACAGFVFALDIVDGFFVRGRSQRALIVSAEKMSRILDWSDRATCVLFGDGAAACVVEAGGESPLAINLACKPNLTALAVPGVTGNSPFDETRDGNGARSAGATAQACALTSEGAAGVQFGVTTICDAVNGLCEQAGIEVSAIDHFIFHQANERILAAASARLGLDDTKVARTLAHTGNISSACIPLYHRHPRPQRRAQTGRAHRPRGLWRRARHRLLPYALELTAFYETDETD